MAGRRWWVVGDRSWMVRVVACGRRHHLCLDGGRLSSLWVVGPVLGRGGQLSFAGGCSEHFFVAGRCWWVVGDCLRMVGIGGLWVIVCRWYMWSLVAVVIPCVRS